MELGELGGHLGHDAGRRPAPRADFSALLPTRGLPRFTPADLLKALNAIVGAAGAGAELVPELTSFEQGPGSSRIWHRPKAPPRIGVAVAGIALMVEGHDRPALEAGEASELTFRSWPGGARDLARARAHVRVSEARPALAADLDLNHDRAMAVTALAAAVCQLAQPAGVVWESSGVAVAAAELVAAMPAMMGGEPPVALWIGAGVEAAGAARGTVATRGLYPLLGAEVELRAPALSPHAAERVVLELAAEILETGRPPAEGARIERRPQGAFRVRYRAPENDGAAAIVLEEIPLRGAPAVGATGTGDLAAGAA